MTDESQPAVPEKMATHKAATQKWVIGVLGGLFLVLCVLLLWTVVSNKSAKQAKAMAKAATTQAAQEGKPTQGSSSQSPSKSFFEQVDSRVSASQRKAADDNKAGTDTFAEAKPLTPMQKVQEEAKTRSARSAQAGASAQGQLSPEEQYAKQERLRALQSRQSRSKLEQMGEIVSDSQLSDVKQNARRLARPVNAEKASLEQRQTDVRSRIEEARRLKASLMNSQNPLADAESSLTPKNANPLFAKKSTSSKPETVGFSKTNADAEQMDIAGKELLPTATVISAVLAQTTMSDYPGLIKGIVTHDVYNGSYEKILIPKGSEILIKSVGIANVNLPIQARMGLTVPWVILPNGKRIDFSRAAALDHMGIGAIKDEVDYHFMAQFLGVAAYAVLASSTASNSSSSQFTGENNFEGDVGEAMRKQFAPLAARYLTLVPTITLNTGTPFKIIIEDDMYLEPWSTIYDNLISHN